MSTAGHPRVRTFIWAIAGMLLLVVLIDGGSCAIARVQLDDDAKQAGRYAVQQIAPDPVNQATAEIAYQAAQSALPNDKEDISTAGFSVNQDHSITMTVTRSAPTLLLKYLPTLKAYTTAKVTYTQPKLGM